MSFLLDTCVVSERLKKEPNSRVLDWLDAQEATSLYISAISLGEIEKGIGLLPESSKKERLRRWVSEDLIPFFGSRLRGVGLRESIWWGGVFAELQLAGSKPSVVDSLIAATAVVNGLTLVTRNEEDFRNLKVAVFNPWAQG